MVGQGLEGRGGCGDRERGVEGGQKGRGGMGGREREEERMESPPHPTILPPSKESPQVFCSLAVLCLCFSSSRFAALFVFLLCCAFRLLALLCFSFLCFSSSCSAFGLLLLFLNGKSGGKMYAVHDLVHTNQPSLNSVHYNVTQISRRDSRES